MKLIGPTFLFVILSAGLLAQSQPSASPDVLLKAAMQKEQIDNDLPAAIAQYKAIVEKFPKDVTAPKALMQLAGIYQRLGDVVAEREVYERIARDYPNSGAPAAAAREHLSLTTAPRLKETELTVTGKAAGMLGNGRVSPDGRFISFADQNRESLGGTGNLAIWDTRSGQTTVVNKFSNREPWADGSAEDSIWSPDGRQLAYTWSVKLSGVNRREIRIVNRADGKHRTVFAPVETMWMVPLAWSPDQRTIAAGLAAPAGAGTVGPSQLALISVADGGVTTLRRFDGSLPAAALFSQDGKFLAYDFQPVKGLPARDVSVITIDGARETPVVSDRSANDALLGWLPDGHLLFTSDRDGSVDAWAIRVTNGVPVGTSLVVQREVGRVQCQGVTRDGRVFVWKWAEYRDVYIAELDPVTGKAVGPPAPLARAQPTVKRGEPAWSPDGLRIAYVQSAPGVAPSVVVHSLATNELRVYQVSVRNLDWVSWSPDGRTLFFDGTGEDNVQRMFKLDSATGRVDKASDPRRVIIGVSADSQSVYEIGGGKGFSRRSTVDGSTVVLGPGGVGMALSPDGRWVAYIGAGARQQRPLMIRPVAGGQERVLVPNFAPGYARLTWWPDSRFVIFNDNPTGLNRVSIDGGPREALGVGGPGFGVITEKSMNIDGRRLAVAVSRDRTELWVWENVVPRAKQP